MSKKEENIANKKNNINNSRNKNKNTNNNSSNNENIDKSKDKDKDKNKDRSKNNSNIKSKSKSKNSNDINSKNKIYFASFSFLIILILSALVFLQIRYHNRGNMNLPFDIENILVVSTATGKKTELKGESKEKEENKNKENLNIKQINDVYIKLSPKEDSKLKIKKVSVNNFNIVKSPNKGQLSILKPTGDLGNLFTASSENIINSGLDFKATQSDDFSNLETDETGGTIVFRIENDLGDFLTEKDKTIFYDSRLIQMYFNDIDDLKFEISFNLEITLINNQKYTTTINIKKPNSGILNNNKIVKYENEKEYIFKRK